jgi:hypothetical protein
MGPTWFRWGSPTYQVSAAAANHSDSGVLCCAVLCCAVLCCAVLCCAVLCCAVLCCAVLCCAVLCCAVWTQGVDISLFINNLPGGTPTHSFRSDDASGSTSQAANIQVWHTSCIACICAFNLTHIGSGLMLSSIRFFDASWLLRA